MTEVSERQFEIIEAAGRILTDSGIKGLTIKNLAREMKFSESAIYRHFSSKEEIIIAMLDFLAADMDSRLSEALDPKDEPLDQFLSLFDNQFQFFKANSHFVVAVFSDGLMEESKKINEAIFRIMTVKTSHLKPVLKKGIESGVFTDEIPLNDLTHIVLGTFRMQMFKWRITQFYFDLTKQGEKTMGSLMQLIKKL